MRDISNDKFTGPWLSYDAVPNLREAFEMNRDEYIRRQHLAMQKTEAERREAQGREEQQGRGSGMVGQDKPNHDLKPPSEIRRPVLRKQFNDRWLKEHRDAAMSQGKIHHLQHEHSKLHQRNHQRPGPERSR